MAGFVYGGKFEETVNRAFSPENIQETAKMFLDFEKRGGTYSFGMFVKSMIPRQADWVSDSGSSQGFSDWEKNAAGIPPAIRDRLTDIIRTNLESALPLPMLFKITDNVDATHDLYIRTFAHDGKIYIGVLLLCPNPKLYK